MPELGIEMTNEFKIYFYFVFVTLIVLNRKMGLGALSTSIMLIKV